MSDHHSEIKDTVQVSHNFYANIDTIVKLEDDLPYQTLKLCQIQGIIAKATGKKLSPIVYM